VADAALLYAVMANNGLPPELAAAAPPPALPKQLHAPSSGAKPLAGLRLGVYRPWYNSAEPEVRVRGCLLPRVRRWGLGSGWLAPRRWRRACWRRALQVVAACDAALQLAEQLGAQLVEVALPELELLRVAHVATIVSEPQPPRRPCGGAPRPPCSPAPARPLALSCARADQRRCPGPAHPPPTPLQAR
jgi:Asp-tRNA(Asn)/Glu-tRNA(Gln) amidotransferase A subunit family amidase